MEKGWGAACVNRGSYNTMTLEVRQVSRELGLERRLPWSAGQRQIRTQKPH